MSAPVISSDDEKLRIYKVMLDPHEKNKKIMTLPVNAITDEKKDTEVLVYFSHSPQRLSKYKIVDVKEDKDEKTIELERIESPKLKSVIKFHKGKEDTEQLFVRFYIPKPTRKQMGTMITKLNDRKLPDKAMENILEGVLGKSKAKQKREEEQKQKEKENETKIKKLYEERGVKQGGTRRRRKYTTRKNRKNSGRK